MVLISSTALITLINVYSVKLTARLITGLSFFKIVAMVVVIALGVWHFINKGIK